MTDHELRIRALTEVATLGRVGLDGVQDLLADLDAEAGAPGLPACTSTASTRPAAALLAELVR